MQAITTTITTTAAIMLGVTFYTAEPDAGLACGGVFAEQPTVWAAVPIEWNKDGYVSCGDLALITTADGHTILAPILDFGCHLHYPVGKSVGGDGKLCYGADIPRLKPTKGWKTGVGSIAVWRMDEHRWWTIPPLTAWGTQWCNGPLTGIPTPIPAPNMLHEPY